ncbi:hypothetical protein MYCTH_2079848 [Thermothelomyces thermophilus ATCC 42464]|uniref:Uncharacterized protein n=1 Tax=Thermothelomyces thermophilus (strain ATCC 42464 / BCRC 31852 / DSM 1799) TaxID=573729 RepID=G2QEH5_THET4|nr:uncharacterized protein MYCTH_2079848 [Thermothelomyces thermophilus ATCC 42464]AEO57758.1 hypothetical protein MYCTH_2079848 [Thermothelomyces thermophilus ATCC 42464]
MSPRELNRAETPPFLVKLFYRTGAFHRPEEFNTPSSLPPHLQIHTWPDCTLLELSYHIADASPPVLPDPAVGTRLCFSLVYADTRGRTDTPPRYVSKFLGSVVLGRGGPGASRDPPRRPGDELDGGAGSGDGGGDDDNNNNNDDDDDNHSAGSSEDESLTLADARFITGDFISCAILPPDELTGDVVPASSARMGRGAGVGEARGGYVDDEDAPPPPYSRSRRGSYGGPPPPGGGRMRGGYRSGGPRGYGGGGGRYRDRDEPFGRGGVRIPDGEWRRGDRLPDEPPEIGRWGR